MNTIEGLAKNVFTQQYTGETADYKFPRMPYAEAMERFGSDKPDIRFGVELKDLTDIAKNCGFKAFHATVANGGIVKAIVAPQVLLINSQEKFLVTMKNMQKDILEQKEWLI